MNEGWVNCSTFFIFQSNVTITKDFKRPVNVDSYIIEPAFHL